MKEIEELELELLIWLVFVPVPEDFVVVLEGKLSNFEGK